MWRDVIAFLLCSIFDLHSSKSTLCRSCFVHKVHRFIQLLMMQIVGKSYQNIREKSEQKKIGTNN